MPKKQSRSYEELQAKGLRKRPVLTDAEEVLKKDYPLKLPARTWVHLYNSPEISQFRGLQNEIDEREKQIHDDVLAREAIRQAAREGTEDNTVNMGVAHEMLARQRQMGDALHEHMSGIRQGIQREMRAMQLEQEASLANLKDLHNQARKKQDIADTAVANLRDAALEHRNAIQRLAERQGHVVQLIDQRHIESNVDQRQNFDVNIHNQAMAMIASHNAQFEEYMRLQRVSAEQMQQAVYAFLKQASQRETTPLGLSLPPMPFEAEGSAAPTIPTPVPKKTQHYRMDTPPRRGRSRDRRTPWKSGNATPTPMPAPMKVDDEPMEEQAEPRVRVPRARSVNVTRPKAKARTARQQIPEETTVPAVRKTITKSRPQIRRIAIESGQPAPKKAIKQRGTEKDENTSREYWLKQSKGYIFDQISLRGIRGVKGLGKMNRAALVNVLLGGG